MESKLITDAVTLGWLKDSFQALLWKSWRESRVRFACSLALMIALVAYFVLTSSDFLSGYAVQHPDEPLTYSAYIWTSLFDYFFQGLWVAAAFVLGLGGLGKEKTTGEALYTLGLPVSRTHGLLVRSFVALVESASLAVIPALLIPMLSAVTSNAYPWQQALGFASLLALAGTVFVGLGLLMSAIFEGELTPSIVGFCLITCLFFASKAKVVHRWSLFDVMNGSQYIDPYTHLLNGTAPWLGLSISVVLAASLLCASGWLTRKKDF